MILDSKRKRFLLLNAIRRESYRAIYSTSDIFYISLSLIIGFALGARFTGQMSRAASSYIEVKAVAPSVTPTPSPIPTPLLPQYRDERIQKLHKFLSDKQSPLAPYAEFIIAQADLYDIGWTKLVSIAGIESGYGTKNPDKSYNAWGINKWVNGKRSFAYFNSWEESIAYTSEMLHRLYKPSEVRSIQVRYCPESDNCNPAWADIVTNNTNAILAVSE